MKKRIFLSPPHLGDDEEAFVKEAFESNYIAPLGPMVDAFEREFSEYTGIRHCAAVSSGTAAMHLGLRYLGVGPGAKSLTQRRKDAKGERQSEKGSPLRDLGGFARENVLHAGKGARAAVFSFNGNKIMTTSGGGMLASDDGELIGKARFWAQQARENFAHYEHEEIGYNYRMSNILAAIGRGQLRVLDARVKRKREIFDYYRRGLKDVPGIEFMPEPKWSRSNRWLTVILITPEVFGARREDVRLALEAENIESRPVWKPMHLQPVFGGKSTQRRKDAKAQGRDGKKRYPCRMVGGEVSEDLFERGLCLPSGTAMENGDLDRVIDVVLKAGAKIIGDGIKGVVNKH